MNKFIWNNYARFFCFILSAIYAYFLFLLPSEFFKDRDSYVSYASYNLDFLFYYEGLSVYFNEPLFLVYNYLIGFLFSPETIPRFTALVIGFTFFYHIVRQSRNIFIFVVAACSLIFVYYLFHQQLVVLRQGLATAILLWAVYFTRNKNLLLIVILFLAFIHSSFFIIFFVFFSERVLAFFIKNIEIRVLILCLIMLLGAIFMLEVAQHFGVRQAESEHVTNNENGIGGFLLFSFLLCFMYLRGVRRVYSSIYGYFAVLGFLIYLAFYFTIPISGRVIGTFLPFYLIYVVSDFSPKIFYPFAVFLMISFYMFHGSVSSGSLTYEGAMRLNNLLGM